MKQVIGLTALAFCLAATGPVRAQSEVSAASAVAGAVAALPVALSATGAILVVKTVESTARGTLLVLERASDGARVSIEITGKGVAAASLVTGATVMVSVIGAGAILSAAGEVIAFIPNRLGQALLHDERLTY